MRPVLTALAAPTGRSLWGLHGRGWGLAYGAGWGIGELGWDTGGRHRGE